MATTLGRHEARDLGDIRGQVVERLRARRGEIALAIHARLQEAVPHPADDEDDAFRSGVLAAIVAGLDQGLEAITHGADRQGPISQEAIEQARRAARADASVGVVLRGYLAGHVVLGEFVMEEAELCGLAGDGSALHQIRKTQNTLLERVTAAIEHEYMSERARMGSSDRRRCEIVQKLLVGKSVAPAEMVELDYEIHGLWHLGLMLTGTGGEALLDRLRARHGWQLLVVSFDGHVRAWLGAPTKLSPGEIARLWPSGATTAALALGEPGKGMHGWHLTHDQARDAMRVAVKRPRRLAQYAEGRLLAAALHDQTLTTSLEEAYIRPLAGQRDGGITLRRTLRAYLDLECNASSAAHALRVGRHAVKSRVRIAEELIGRPLHDCLAELDVALSLDELERETTGDEEARTAPE